MAVKLEHYVNASTLAQALGISRSGLFQLVKRGELPQGYRLGHSRRWCLEEVKDWLKKQKGATA